jgi:hypothetical protein
VVSSAVSSKKNSPVLLGWESRSFQEPVCTPWWPLPGTESRSFIHQPVVRNSKRQSANDVKKLYVMTSVIMCNRPGAESDDEWRNDHQNNTFSFLFRLTDFFTQINKRHYTRLLYRRCHIQSESHHREGCHSTECNHTVRVSQSGKGDILCNLGTAWRCIDSRLFLTQ